MSNRQPASPACTEALAGGVTLFVGQSGVGKSSIINALAPAAAAQTAELTRDAEGRHTTTTARWYRLGSGRQLGHRRCPGCARLRTSGEHRARRRARLRRDLRTRRELPLQGLPAHGRARLRGARRRADGAHRRAPLRKLPQALRVCTKSSRSSEAGRLAFRTPSYGPPAHAPACRRRRIRVPRPPARHGRCARP